MLRRTCSMTTTHDVLVMYCFPHFHMICAYRHELAFGLQTLGRCLRAFASGTNISHGDGGNNQRYGMFIGVRSLLSLLLHLMHAAHSLFALCHRDIIPPLRHGDRCVSETGWNLCPWLAAGPFYQYMYHRLLWTYLGTTSSNYFEQRAEHPSQRVNGSVEYANCIVL